MSKANMIEILRDAKEKTESALALAERAAKQVKMVSNVDLASTLEVAADMLTEASKLVDVLPDTVFADARAKPKDA